MLLRGIGTSGMATGYAYVVRNISADTTYSKGTPEEELQAVARAMDKTRKHLQTLSATSDIFAAHAEMVDDPMLLQTIEGYIQDDALSAPDAIDATSEALQVVFREMDDEYLRARADDVKDICIQLRNNVLSLSQHQYEDLMPGSILVADELLPSDTSYLDFSALSGIVTAKGNRTSHVCIIANNKGVPSVVGVNDCMHSINTGDYILLDAGRGYVYVNPDEETRRQFESELTAHNESSAVAEAHAYEKAVTMSGKAVPVMGNAGDIDDVKAALAAGADGIGLFRSEFLFMDKTSLPDEDTQYQAYLEAAKLCGDKPLTIRLLDIGGDKCPSYIHLEKEDNPFLGMRGIRFLLAHKDIFKTQLKAILRASVSGDIRIMLPFVSDAGEIDDTLALMAVCRQELTEAGTGFNPDVKIGIMIETPAAVLAAAILAEKVAFFSIGTNDLTQYVMAADRNDGLVRNYYNVSHPAVMRAIKLVTEEAHVHGITISVCGEAASDVMLTQQLLQNGADALSVNATAVARVKAHIREM